MHGQDVTPLWPGRVEAVHVAFELHAAEQEHMLADIAEALPGAFGGG